MKLGWVTMVAPVEPRCFWPGFGRSSTALGGCGFERELDRGVGARGHTAGVSEIEAMNAILAGESADVRRAVELIGQILAGSVTSRTTFGGFVQANLGRSGSDLVCESRKLSSIGHITVGLAIAALIERFDPLIGPGDDDEPPTWGHVKVGEQHLAPPAALPLYFAAGQVAPAPIVIRLSDSFVFSDGPRLQAYATPVDRSHAATVIETIMADADGAKNLFRGRTLSATEDNGLTLQIVDLPILGRADVVVPQGGVAGDRPQRRRGRQSPRLDDAVGVGGAARGVARGSARGRQDHHFSGDRPRTVR